MSKTVDLRSGKGTQLVLHADGKTKTYHQHGFDVWFKVLRLDVLLRPGSSTRGQLASALWGTATIEKCRGLSIIGAPTKKTHTVSISLQEANPDALAQLAEEKTAHQPLLGFASLGFIRQDWETGTEEDFFLEVLLPKETVQALLYEVQAGRLSGLVVGAKFEALYLDEDPTFTPVAEPKALFLRPNARDNSLESPETANGFATALRADGKKVVLQLDTESDPAEETEALAPQEGLLVYAPAQPDAQLVSAVQALRTTIKWVGGLVVFALLLLVMK